MGKLLKTFFPTIISSSIALFSTSCESVEETVEEPIQIAGKVFVDSYLADTLGSHSAGIEIFEFTDRGTFSDVTGFCYLAGNYLTYGDTLTGMYTLANGHVSLAYKTYTKTGEVKRIGDKLVLEFDEWKKYAESEKTGQTLLSEFKKKHYEDLVDPVAVDALESIRVEENLKFLAENNRKSLVITIDSISGSLKDSSQVVDFRIENIPGNFRVSDKGGRYLVKIGKNGFATTDESYSLKVPEDVLMVLSDKDDFTLVSPSKIENLKNKSKVTKFAPFVLQNNSNVE